MHEINRYFFVVITPTKNEVFSDTDLEKLRKKKHNYKSSIHFKNAYISPIRDIRKTADSKVTMAQMATFKEAIA